MLFKSIRENGSRGTRVGKKSSDNNIIVIATTDHTNIEYIMLEPTHFGINKLQ